MAVLQAYLPELRSGRAHGGLGLRRSRGGPPEGRWAGAGGSWEVRGDLGGLKVDEIDWSQSKIIFVSPSFNSYQKDSVNFKNLPFEALDDWTAMMAIPRSTTNLMVSNILGFRQFCKDVIG